MENEKIIYKKICKHCGKEFETTNPQKIYCDDKCRRDYHSNKARVEKKIYNRTCPICGKEFETDRINKIYCTTKCANKYKIRKKRGIVDSDYDKVCLICGKSFRAFRRTEIFCSIPCYKKNYEEMHREDLAEKRRVYREENKEAVKKRKKKYYEDNKDKISQKGKIRYTKNKEIVKERTKNYYNKNKTIIKIKTKEYVKNNRQKILQRENRKYKTDVNYRLRKKCRGMLNRCLSQKKKGSSSVILGYTPEELRMKLESLFYNNMNWENYNLWEIHHIRPLDTFNFINEDDTDNYNIIKEANALDNLIPLFKEDHKKLTQLYLSEKKWLNLNEIKQIISGEEAC